MKGQPVRDPTLSEVLQAYSGHPEFDRELDDPNALGADNSVLNIASYRGNLSHVRVLVLHGANVNFRGDMGYTALHDAVSRGHRPVIEYLLDHGADPRIANEFGETAFDLAHKSNDKRIASLIRRYKR